MIPRTDFLMTFWPVNKLKMRKTNRIAMHMVDFPADFQGASLHLRVMVQAGEDTRWHMTLPQKYQVLHLKGSQTQASPLLDHKRTPTMCTTTIVPC